MTEYSTTIEQRFNIDVTMRNGEHVRLQDATYTEESWCVRMVTDTEAVRINRNAIESIRMSLSE